MIDVLYDLAFLLMDLVHRSRADLAKSRLPIVISTSQTVNGWSACPAFLPAVRASIRARM